MEGEGALEAVVDASVVVKWYVVEEHRERALKLRDDFIDGKIKLAAPAIMPFEVLNAVRYSKRTIEAETLKAVAESLALYGFELYSIRDRYAELVVEVALDNDITIYDASYVALAKHLRTVVYTADRELIAGLSGEYRDLARDIREYGTE